jgi:hypothetical protein
MAASSCQSATLRLRPWPSHGRTELALPLGVATRPIRCCSYLPLSCTFPALTGSAIGSKMWKSAGVHARAAVDPFTRPTQSIEGGDQTWRLQVSRNPWSSILSSRRKADAQPDSADLHTGNRVAGISDARREPRATSPCLNGVRTQRQRCRSHTRAASR